MRTKPTAPPDDPFAIKAYGRFNDLPLELAACLAREDSGYYKASATVAADVREMLRVGKKIQQCDAEGRSSEQWQKKATKLAAEYDCEAYFRDRAPEASFALYFNVRRYGAPHTVFVII